MTLLLRRRKFLDTLYRTRLARLVVPFFPVLKNLLLKGAMPPPSLPTVDQQTIRIFPSVIDEWYGTLITFSWKSEIDQHVLDACVEARNLTDQAGRALLQHVFRSLRQSDAWAKFYEAPQSVECDVNGSDSSKRTVTIPVFSWADACYHGEWDFSHEGGNILIDIR